MAETTEQIHIEDRYPIQYPQTILQDEARAYLHKGKEMLLWLARQLPTQ